MNLTIVYHLNNYSNSLDKSFESLKNQNNKNFEIIIIADGTSKTVQKFFVDIDLNKYFKSVKYIKISQKLYHGCSNNLALKYVKTPYVYFTNACVVYNKNFTDDIIKAIDKENADIFVFNTSNSETNKRLDKNISNLNIQKTYSSLLGNINNKIINTKFIKDNNIQFSNFNHYTFLDTIKLFEHAKKIKEINCKNIEVFHNDSPLYNIYDIIDQNNFILGKEHIEFYKKNIDDINYIMIRNALFVFLLRIAIQEKWTLNHIFRKAYDYAIDWLKTYISDWRKNKILNSPNNLDDKKVISYLKQFPKTSVVTLHKLRKIYKTE